MMDFTLLTFDTLDSTNSEALRQAKLGAEEGLCIVAREQTAGRGRRGREWSSQKDAGLYFSVLLRPKLDPQFLPLITLVAGVAVHEMLAELGLEPDIKWVNDVLINEKKICGILAETTETDTGTAVVLGIGINLHSKNLPEDVAAKSTSIQELGLNPGNDAASNLVRTLTRHIERFYVELLKADGPSSIISEWQQRSTYFSGKRVRVVLENDAIVGVTDGLEPNGALRLRRDDGDVVIIQTGDVERLRSKP